MSCEEIPGPQGEPSGAFLAAADIEAETSIAIGVNKLEAEPIPPTISQYSAYQQAYTYFNEKLFGGTLKPCLLVFRDGRKTARGIVCGHFARNRWATSSDADAPRMHEISLNPDLLAQPLIQTMQTLVHEMCHQWQQDHGTPCSPGYHDKEWAKKMIDVGLMPSHNSQVGGKQTGRSMGDYVIDYGPFAKAVAEMPEACKLPWITGVPMVLANGETTPVEVKAKKPKSKFCYQCECKKKVWGKSGLLIQCGECNGSFTEQE
jgi:predicted SprT family Zn-dependent metalloprotease